MNFFCNRILFIGAHPDDIELGCGAFLDQSEKQNDVLCVTLSDNQKNPDLEHVRDEHLRSMAALGMPSDKVVFGRLPPVSLPTRVRRFLNISSNSEKISIPT